ncbi:flagellar biosynthesis chaperone FliJ [Natronospira proteinivora]|uniref:Flagellar biosynthesis chaperone FliJ n=1 Tax=Natronospira proteinivora TaxID=1807133 RepID=A0ABT1G6U7_9GAMM|nr:hypothetical protein [Natronospira proteinivora]MCP1727026.1 flagellar biosynthesis chaperone FliJ [Natronospira proteinivora]
MQLSEYLPVSGSWWIDVAVAVIVAMILLYLARQTAHEIIAGTSRSLSSILRVAARATQLWADNLQRNGRHGALLLVAEHQERLATRELSNLRKEVRVGLKRYPALRDAVNQNIERIEAEYQASPERPEPPAAWRELIESVAGIRENSDPALKDTLESIRETIEKAAQRLTDQHQLQNRAAERSLARLEPRWSEAAEELTAVNKTLQQLQERIDSTNRRIRRFETIHNQRRSRTARFRGWLALNFVVGSFLLAVGILIALVNFHLIHAPLEEAFGRQATTGPFHTALLTAVTLILAQLALAVIISDTARLSRLIAPIGRLTALKRRVTLGIASVLIVLLALSEASLAFMRDSIYLEAEWLARELEQGVAAGSPDLRWVPSLAQMGMGFVLPLTFIALVPALESFFQTARIAFLLTTGFLTALLATGFRLFSRLISSAGQLLNYGYDLLIVLPLSIERRFRRREPALDSGSEQ